MIEGAIMKIEMLNKKRPEKVDLKIVGAFAKDYQETKTRSVTKASLEHLPKEVQNLFQDIGGHQYFTGQKNDFFCLTIPGQELICLVGLGEKGKLNNEVIRRSLAKAFSNPIMSKAKKVLIEVETFQKSKKNKASELVQIICETIHMTLYEFKDFQSGESTNRHKEFYLSLSKNPSGNDIPNSIKKGSAVAESVNFARNIMNTPPNVLHSEKMAKVFQEDIQKNLKNVRVKILNKAEIKKEKMNLLLAVNSGSYYEPRVVHLTYTPPKKSKKMKHIALVGKGLTFDTGGYSLKPSAAMIDMKFDMGGAATVYSAFRAAALLKSPHKISCILGITDNSISDKAITPDAIVTSRSGKTVEIANTDAEGRLVLADVLDYTCDLKPDHIIDAATLTGACLIAVGHEVCAIMGNDQKFIKKIMDSAHEQNERIWQLPIFEEFHADMSSTVADVRNIGKSRNAGSSKAGAFLEKFIKNDISWAHLDVAGIATQQGHLPYCPSFGSSGLMVRSLTKFLMT